MALSTVLSWLRPRRARAERARADLKSNAEKALRMKQEAETESQIPPHRTAHEGMRLGAEPAATDPSLSREASFTPQRKRSQIARSGDT